MLVTQGVPVLCSTLIILIYANQCNYEQLDILWNA